ncbi:MAG: electron transport complex protein RnfC, partial [Chloroflexota bacterium]
PMHRLVNRLGLARYDVPAPLTETPARFNRVSLALQQHLGVAARPVVKVGDRVQVGEVVGEVPAGAVGACLHASIAGVVRAVSTETIVIEAN